MDIRAYIPNRLKLIIKYSLAKLFYPFYYKKRDKVFKECLKNGINDIPIFIISYNRLMYVKKFIEQLESRGFSKIYIIDNNSTYEPLLEYYKSIPYKVFYMQYNGGHMVFWNDEIFSDYRKNFYIVTDPDLEIMDECPNDFVRLFFDMLWKYPFVRKVGFSLKIDDLPSNDFTADVVKWESQFNKTYLKKDNLYFAFIDTTFALYIPDQLVNGQKFMAAFRTGYPYQVRHVPWYKSISDAEEEDLFYSNSKTNGWWDILKGMTPDEEARNTYEIRKYGSKK